MNLQDNECDDTDMMECTCENCGSAFPTQNGIIVTTEEQWESLKQGTLLQVTCPHCHEVNEQDNLVLFSIDDWNIGQCLYVPPYSLESDQICELLLTIDSYQMAYYSIEELIRQVEARLILLQYLREELEDHPEFIPSRWAPLMKKFSN
jgi:hypothetical protein